MTEFEFEAALGARQGVAFHTRMAAALAQVEDSYDVVLFDTPPHMSFAVIAALYAANALLIPLSAGMLDVVSLVKFLDLASATLKDLEEAYPAENGDGKTFDFIRLLLTRYSPNDAAQMQLAAFLRNTLGGAMTRNEFLSSTAIADAGNTMNPLLEVDPSSFTRKTYDRIRDSLQGIAWEIEEEIMRARGRLSNEEEAA